MIIKSEGKNKTLFKKSIKGGGKMLIVKFWGGLGNQMFEYALFKQLEEHFPANVIRAHIPFRSSKLYNLTNYCLDDVFNIQIKECSWKNVAKLSDMYPEDGPLHFVLNPLSKMVGGIIGHKFTYILPDNFTCFYPEVYRLSSLHSYYLAGAWANYEYLVGIEDILIQDFEFRNGLSEKNREYMKKITNSCSVSIHVRRGDYVKNGCLLTTDDYYMKAIEIINEKVYDPQFFVFSNDHDYCRKLFDDKINYEIVEGNEDKDNFRDMQLMSNCKHNIIANSTFSFWGAFLNKNPEKIVISPNIGIFENTVPFTCPEWIKIDV